MPSPIGRVVLGLSRDMPFDVKAEGHSVVVALTAPRAAAPQALAEPPSRRAALARLAALAGVPWLAHAGCRPAPSSAIVGQIVGAARNARLDLPWADLSIDDEVLLDPRLWAATRKPRQAPEPAPGKPSVLAIIQARMSSSRLPGKVLKPIFSFPGGRRFHFADSAGNELAIWSNH